MIADSPTTPGKKYALQLCEDGLYGYFEVGPLMESDRAWLGHEEYERLAQHRAAGVNVVVAQTLAHNVGFVRIPASVNTQDDDQMRPFYREGARLVEAGHDMVLFDAGRDSAQTLAGGVA